MKMENNSHHSASSGHGNNFFGGFLFGVLVGAAIVFLLATKKGKKILKAISDDGLDNISDILEKAGKKMDLEEMYEDDEGENVPQRRMIAVNEASQERQRPKRFFRGVSRHLN